MDLTYLGFALSQKYSRGLHPFREIVVLQKTLLTYILMLKIYQAKIWNLGQSTVLEEVPRSSRAGLRPQDTGSWPCMPPVRQAPGRLGQRGRGQGGRSIFKGIPKMPHPSSTLGDLETEKNLLKSLRDPSEIGP